MTILKNNILVLCIGLIIYSLLPGCRNELDPPNATPNQLEILADTFTTFSGGSIQLSAWVTMSDNTTSDVTNETTWSISPGQSGTINEEGLFQALQFSSGVETVTADYQGQSASVTVQISFGARSLAIWPMKGVVREGQSIPFRAVAELIDASLRYVTTEAEWTVTPPSFGNVDFQGVFHAASGFDTTAIITARYLDKSVEAEIRIGPNAELPFEMVQVPAGSFTMGDDLGWNNEKPAHTVIVSAFEMSQFEITNAQYVEYLNDALANSEITVSNGIVTGNKGPYSNFTYLAFHTCPEFPDVYLEYVPSELPGGYEFMVRSGFRDHPVVRLNWYGAAAFCNHYGLRLPTEAEWEYACRGGQQLEYGTSDGSISHTVANFFGTGDRDTFWTLAPVGSFDPNPFGLYDICGNAGEYVRDSYSSSYYANSPSHNPTGPNSIVFLGQLPGETAIIRGGSFYSYPYQCRSVARILLDDVADQNIAAQCIGGFRVVRSIH